MTRKTYNYIFSGAIIAIAIYVAVSAWRFPSGDIGTGFGPGIYPLLIAFALMLCAVIVFVQTVWDKTPDEKIHELSLQALKQPILFWGLLLLFCVSLKLIGFLLDGFLYLFIATKVLFKVKWIPSIITSVLITALVYFVFVTAMHVPLPSGTVWVSLGIGG